MLNFSSTILRKVIKRFHPEGIPWPASLLYNAISGTDVFDLHYRLVAKDLARYGPAERIIDIGTGPARLLLALRELFPESLLVGIDISSAMVAKAQQNIASSDTNGRIQVHVAGADTLPYADKTFDRVISTGSLHHWKNPQTCLAEANRVLKQGGLALHHDLVRQVPKSVSQKIRSQIGSFRFALLWLHSFEEPFLNPDEMEKLGKQSSFSLEGTYFVGGLCCLSLRKV